MNEYICSLDPEMEVACPYDNSHMVRRKRMQYHLMKCRKNHPGKEFATCPFNACHEMPRPELRYHMATCPNKAAIEKDHAYEQEMANGDVGTFKGCTDVPAYHTYEVATTECWDDEANPHPRIGVDPALMNKVKFKNITGMTASEKREFHRYLTPEEDEPTRPNVSRPNKENERPAQTDGKLRLPKNAPKAFSMYQGAATPQENRQPPPSTVFAYSLAQAGIGRGRGVASTTTAVSAPPGIPRPAMGRGVPRNANLHPTTAIDSQISNQVPWNPYVQQARSTELPSQLQAYSVPETSARSDPIPRLAAPTKIVEDSTRYEDIPLESAWTQSRPTPYTPRSTETSARAYPIPRLAAPTKFVEDTTLYEDIPPESAWTQSRLTPSMPVPDDAFADQFNLKPVGRGQTRKSTETNGHSGPGKVGQFSDWSVLNIGKAGDNMGGLGRGIRKSPKPSFIVPNVLDKKPDSMKMIAKDWFDSDGSSSGSDIPSFAVSPSHGIEDAKKSKQIQKKLRQIEALEVMQKSGKQLNTEEEVKLSKKEDFLAELAALSL